MARKRTKQAGPSSRPAKVGELIRQELGGMLEGGMVKDPRLSGVLVTVTSVSVTPDLQLARAYVSIFTDDEEVRETVLAGLDSATRMLRRELGARLGLRFTPELKFFYDSSITYGARIEGIFREMKREEAAAAPAEPQSDPEPGAAGEPVSGAADEVESDAEDEPDEPDR